MCHRRGVTGGVTAGDTALGRPRFTFLDSSTQSPL